MRTSEGKRGRGYQRGAHVFAERNGVLYAYLPGPPPRRVSLHTRDHAEAQRAFAALLNADELGQAVDEHPLIECARRWLEAPHGWTRRTLHTARVRIKSVGKLLDAREGARKAEDFDALSRAVGLELGAWLKAHAKGDCDESVVGVAMVAALEAVFGVMTDIEGRCYTAAWIAAERDAFIAAVIEACPELGAAGRPALVTAIDATAAISDRKLAAIEKAKADERAAKVAAERQRKAAEEAAAARAKAAAEALALRWQPFRAEMKRPLSWDAEDGYWTRRRNKRFEALTIDELERYGVQALRVLLALPSKAALKAAESVSVHGLFKIALDAQALAGAVGPSAARHMHVEAGLPKPVIRKKAAEAAAEVES